MSFIKIHREILNWEWWDDINTFRLFVYMIIVANWKDANFKGEMIPRGALVSSIRGLSDKTGLTQMEIRTSIRHLEKTGEITVINKSKFTIYTINNYEKYQADNTDTASNLTQCLTHNLTQCLTHNLTQPQVTSNPVNISVSEDEDLQLNTVSNTVNNTVPNTVNNKVITHNLTNNQQSINNLLTQTEEEKNIIIKEDKNNYKAILEMYNRLCPSFPAVKCLSEARRKALRARLTKYTIDDFETLFKNAEASDFLKGANNRNWQANFDWFIKDTNMAKVLDGNYNKSKIPISKTGNKFNDFPQKTYDFDLIEKRAMEEFEKRLE